MGIPDADTKIRIRSLDVFKGIAIIAIVSIHVLYMQEGMETIGERSLLLQYLSLGLMFFFIISGYFYRSNRTFGENIRNRVMQLFVKTSACVILFPLILYVFLWFCGQPQDFSEYVSNIVKYLVGGARVAEPIYHEVSCYVPFMVCMGYYFLLVMAGAFVIFYASVKKLLKNDYALVAAIAILLSITAVAVETVHVWLPFYAQLIPLAAAFMLVGARMGKIKLLEKMNEQGVMHRKTLITVTISALLSVVLIVVFPTGGNFSFMYFGEYGGYSVFSFFIISVSACIVFMYACMIIAKIPVVSTVLAYFGGATLAILLIHEFIVKIVISPFIELPATKPFPSMSPEWSAVVIIATLLLCVLFIEISPRLLKKLKAST